MKSMFDELTYKSVVTGRETEILSAEHEAVEWQPTPDEDADPFPLDVTLPGGAVGYRDAGKLAKLLGDTHKIFRRGESVTKLTHDDDGQPILRAVKTSALPSLFESVATLYKVCTKKNGPGKVRTTCGKQAAELIAAADPFLESLPPIKLLTNTPILVERDGQLVEIVGYDRTAAVFAGGPRAANVSLDDARRLLLELLDDFRFATPADKSRALAAIITPALLHGGLLCGRAPVDLGEADKSQTGKGYRNKITAAIYATRVRSVTQRGSGVGGMEETFNSLVIKGVSILAFDNVRGKINSPAIESFLTEDRYVAREPYSGNVEIDPRRIVVMMTSNNAKLTDDFANRVSSVQMLKQPDGYQFRRWPSGNLLDHVRENQPLYLGAVFAVVKEWHRQSRPRTNETRHDFCEWAQTLDWIVQHILDQAPLLDGLRETLERTTNPNLTFLRDLSLAVSEVGQLGHWLQTNQLLDLLVAADWDIPGVEAEADIDDEKTRNKALQAIGRKLGSCFTNDRLELGGIICERKEANDKSFRIRKTYRFTRSETEDPRITARTDSGNTAQTPKSPAPPNQLSTFQQAVLSTAAPKILKMFGSDAGTSGIEAFDVGVTSGDFGDREIAGSQSIILKADADVADGHHLKGAPDDGLTNPDWDDEAWTKP
jgi:hypothetical protein